MPIYQAILGNGPVHGSSSPDEILGTYGTDVLYGGGGGDIIIGGLGTDFLYGEDGDDIFVINGSEGTDYYNGGSGYDTIYITNVPNFYNEVELSIGSLTGVESIINNSNKSVSLFAERSLHLSGVDTYNISEIRGGSLASYITGSNQRDTIVGQNANDYFVGWRGNDIIRAGGGNDEVSGDGEWGTPDALLISGADTLYGEAGDDKISGGLGDDVLFGGAGADQFRFHADDGVDIIKDFENGSDKIYIASDIMTINLYDYQGSALVAMDNTFALLEGISVTTIDLSDFMFG